MVVATLNGKPLRIDFLNGILGVSNTELSRGVSELVVEADVDGRTIRASIKLLHPIACLKSRVANILHRATCRTDLISKLQLEAAYVVVRRYIHDALDDDTGWKEARDCLSALFRYMRSDQFGKVAHQKLGLDILDIIRDLATDERIDSRYRDFQLQRMIALIEHRRARLEARSAAV